MRNLTGIRFGMIDVVSNPTGQELPFPAEFALSGNFLLDNAGKRVQYGMDSPPLLPTLTGATALGNDFSEDGGHGLATGTGRFMGVTTDFSVDFYVSEAGMSALVTIGKGGNLPGGKPVELSISVAEAWQAGP